jgi:MFS family permease
MTEARASGIRRDPTDVRFGMRSLLVLMAVVAAACTGLSAFIHGFPKDARPRVLGYWGIFFVLLAVCIAYDAWRRLVAERQAGSVRFLLPLHSFLFPRAPRIAAMLVGLCLVAAGPAMWAVGSFFVAENVNAIWMQMISWQNYVSVVLTGVGVSYFWWQRKARVGENGVVMRYNFLPWNDCHRWYRDACYRDIIVLEYARNGRVAVKVSEQERAAVEEFLAEQCRIPA